MSRDIVEQNGKRWASEPSEPRNNESRRAYQNRRTDELIRASMKELCEAQAWLARARKAKARGDFAMAEYITKTQLV
jgi:hypothetical protein